MGLKTKQHRIVAKVEQLMASVDVKGSPSSCYWQLLP